LIYFESPITVSSDALQPSKVKPFMPLRRLRTALRANFNSIATRLILIGIAFIVLGGLGRGYFLSSYLRDDIAELSSAQLLTLANYVARDVDHDIVERRESLERLAAKFPLNLLHDPKQLQSWLAERHEINPLFSQGLAVLAPSGVALADYPVLAERAGNSFAERDYFQQAMQGEFAIGAPVMGQVSRLPVLPMAMPLRDGAGKIQGVLVGVSALHSPNFMDALYTTRVGTAGALVLVSPQDKLFVGASDSNIALTPIPQEGKHPQHDQAMKGFRGVSLDVNEQGIEELAAIASVPSNGWFVVARLPASEAFAPLSRLRHFILSNTTIVILVFCFVLVFVLRAQLRPLINAARHADRMTLGEIPFEPLPVARDDEVGHLTTAFNRLLSKLLESRAELQHIAHHDTLTGLPNRQLLADRMKQALARAQRNHSSVAVLFLDLDGFKPINDRSGHEAGDAALREVADRLNKIVRRDDTLARVGGDEFVILLSDLTEHARASAELVAKKCLEIFQEPFIINEQSCQLGTSIGIAIGDIECSPDKLLIAADEAMYRAKEAGRGKFFWATE
jgi:diguanylate cyclase (GGDEF)-like protein